ncbi:hypothetical protein Thena_1738 [Thermodesulfobium narugense DSM 14796]|uniref:Uncharacterized protein n=1 Tax=Thermodesulfobium narugense DSM 14796 TaxID=747365 RepID=M1E955_9BACT|nr:WYL domain-containing protein [Thermodesulfobium narugense]AEE15345.1 hypothetical protein Thena_1738 [Thermodesulfobium narugense DSM 14796]
MISKIYKLEILKKIKEFTNEEFWILGKEEMRWLNFLIDTDESKFFFTKGEIDKLKNFLSDSQKFNLSKVVIKNKPKRDERSWIFLEPIIKAIIDCKNIKLEYRTSNFEQFKSICFPYKIEFEFYKNEWYLLWLNLSNNKKMMRTPFSSIIFLETIEREIDLSKEAVEIFDEKNLTALFSVEKRYSDDLKRILLILIDFNPVLKKENSKEFLFEISFKPSEEGYLLQLFRYLGQRAIILKPSNLVEKMLLSYRKSLERYSKKDLEIF